MYLDTNIFLFSGKDEEMFSVFQIHLKLDIIAVTINLKHILISFKSDQNGSTS